MKKQLLLLVILMLPLVASAHDIAVQNADGVTIYYNYINDGKELEVTFRRTDIPSNHDTYTGNVVIPEEVTYMNRTRKVTGIGIAAFNDCSALYSVTIPNSVTSIGSSAFYGCFGLTSISIPNSVTSIGSGAFYKCEKLTSITIPNGVTSIDYSTFYECSMLTCVTIPSSVTRIDPFAFYKCEKLTSITIPNGVTLIGQSAFYGCSGLTSITIPNGVTNIGEYTFYGCSGLTSITIPNGVTNIGERAFMECSGLNSITIGSGVTSIGEYAFYGCSGLTSITIPNSVRFIKGKAFSSCSHLKKVIVSDIVAWCGIKFYESSSNPLDNARHLYSDENTEIKDLIIPNSVTKIGEYTFYGCSGLTSITIPNSVKSIGVSAFSGCYGLTSITIPNSVTSIGNSAFYGCSGLTSITIPNSVTYIGDGAFRKCSGLNSVTILCSKVGTSWFKELTSIKEVILGNSVTSIGDHAFYGCSGLTSITIPNSVTSIDNYAFYGCSGLTSITIPNSVTYIGDHAFYGCSGLAYVTSLNTTPPQVGSRTFSNYNATLYVPTGFKTVYESHQIWKNFTSIVEIDVSNIQYTLTYLVDGEVYKTYKLKVGDMITPEAEPIKEGYTFSGWSEIPSTMPAHDVTVSGTFTKNEPNQYTLTYLVDGEVYMTYKLKVGDTITPEAEPTKEGYTFSGWSEIPSTMPDHDVTVSGTFTKNGSGTDDDNPSNYKSLDDYIVNSNTTLQNNNYTINPIIKKIKKVYIDLTKGTTISTYCYLGIVNNENTKRIDISSMFVSTSNYNFIVYENNNTKSSNIKKLVDNKTYSWLYYNPKNSNEVIIDVEAFFGCLGHINGWQKSFGTSFIVNIVTDSTETSIVPIESDSEDKDDKYYNLQGQRVLYPRNGIYIKNGKKIFIK